MVCPYLTDHELAIRTGIRAYRRSLIPISGQSHPRASFRDHSPPVQSNSEKSLQADFKVFQELHQTYLIGLNLKEVLIITPSPP